MQTHDEMIDSGIDWLGMIPKHWSLLNTSRLFTFSKGVNAQQLTSDYIGTHVGEYPVYSGQTNNGGIIGLYEDYEFDEEGCILVTTVGAKAMTARHINGKFSLSQNCLIMKPHNGDETINTRYFSYAVLPLFIKERALIPDHMQPSMRMSDLSSYRLPLPSSVEQQKIADFLDAETAKIDNLIAKQERLLELLEEKRRATITHAVTRGLDPNVELKETNIPWLGKIPVHWHITMTRHLFRQVKTPVGASSSEYKLLSLTLRGIIPRADVSGGKNPENYDTYQAVEPGDMVVCLFDYDVTPRTVGYVREAGMVTGAYTVLQPVANLNVEYYSLLFEALDNTKELLHLCTGMRNGLSKPTFFGLNLPVPPLDEQGDIVASIAKRESEVSELKNKIQTQISLLRERRTSLISHAVTGKIKV